MSAEVAKAKQEFWRIPSITIAVLMVIHLLPKAQMQANLRLLLTLALFAALFILLWSMTAPRERYMERLYAWRYEDAGPALEKSWRLYLHSLTRVIRIVAVILATFLATTALKTLSLWPSFSSFSLLAPVYQGLWWLSVAALGLFPFVAGGLVAEAMQRGRLLREQVATSDFEPRKDLPTNEEAAAQSARAPVEAVNDSRFLAGNFEWSWEDFYKNCIVFGQAGTGKTVCVLNALLDGLLLSSQLSSHQPSCLMLDPKGDFHAKIQNLTRLRGREADLLRLDPTDLEHSIRWNPLDSDDDELELAGRFAAVMEALGMKSDNDSFWVDSAKKFIRHAIALIRLTNPPGEPPSFEQINAMASSFGPISERADRLADDDPRGDRCLAYFADEWANLADETRSSIQANITNMIDPFLLAPYDTLFSGRSTVRIADVVDRGKLLYVYMPIADKEVMARMVCTFIKMEYYREVLKRPDKKRPSFFFCDEFQSFFTVSQGKGDADFFERSRQSRHANIIATQNLNALTKQTREKDPVFNLLGNCAVKIFLRNTDRDTNEYASNLFGEQLVAMLSQSLSSHGKGLGGGGGGGSQGANLQYDAKVRKEVFTELAVPSRDDGTDYCETVIHLASRGRVAKLKQRWRVYPL